MNDDAAELQTMIDRAANSPWWKRWFYRAIRRPIPVTVEPNMIRLMRPLILPPNVALRGKK